MYITWIRFPETEKRKKRSSTPITTDTGCVSMWYGWWWVHTTQHHSITAWLNSLLVEAVRWVCGVYTKRIGLVGHWVSVVHPKSR